MGGADICMVNNESLLYNVDYYSKFLVMKKVKSMPAEDLIWVTKVIFAKFGLPKKLIQMWAQFFFSEWLKKFCRHLNVDQAVTSSYHNQRNGQAEACIKFIRCAIKKCIQNNYDVNFALLQIRSTPVNTGIPSQATLLFNRPIRVLLPQLGGNQ